MVTLRPPAEIAVVLTARARERRLARGWSQAEVVRRAGGKLPTDVLCERAGRVSLGCGAIVRWPECAAAVGSARRDDDPISAVLSEGLR